MGVPRNNFCSAKNETMIRLFCIFCIFVVLTIHESHTAPSPSPQVSAIPQKHGSPDQATAYQKEKMKKEMSKRMSVLENLDKKGKDEDFIPWAMGWISSATSLGAGAK